VLYSPYLGYGNLEEQAENIALDAKGIEKTFATFRKTYR